jgi:N-acetylneuraminic acid mutarotase
MTTARGGAAVQVVDGKIYVIGGMDATGASLSSVEIYDPVSNSWTTGTPMLTRRDNPGAAVLDDVLYVFGGRTRNADDSVVDGTLASMELYDPTADIWTAGPSMNVPRRTMSVGTISGRAQVMGGENPVVAANEEYDPATNTWRFLTPMALPRHGAATATIYGSVFVAGGGDNAGSSFTDVIQSFSY